MVLKATVSYFEEEDSYKVYVTSVEKDGVSWRLKIRYSRFEALLQAIKQDVVDVPFPGDISVTVLCVPLLFAMLLNWCVP